MLHFSTAHLGRRLVLVSQKHLILMAGLTSLIDRICRLMFFCKYVDQNRVTACPYGTQRQELQAPRTSPRRNAYDSRHEVSRQ